VINPDSGEEVTVDALSDSDYFLREGEVKIFVSSPIENYVDSNPLTDVISGVENLDESQSMFFQIYPNPTSETIIINDVQTADAVHIFNIEGQLVFEKKIMTNTQGLEITFPSLSNGQYEISLSRKGQILGSQNFQIIK